MAGAGGLTWLKSNRCDTSSCVEVAVTDDRVFLRDSKDPDGPRLTFTHEQWVEFLRGLGRGVPDETL
jgi:Domain of unknown function (DUF397)